MPPLEIYAVPEAKPTPPGQGPSAARFRQRIPQRTRAFEFSSQSPNPRTGLLRPAGAIPAFTPSAPMPEAARRSIC